MYWRDLILLIGGAVATFGFAMVVAAHAREARRR
jgi:hypothetical protein